MGVGVGVGVGVWVCVCALLLKHNIKFKGWNSRAYRGFPGIVESMNLSRDNLSMEIGRIEKPTRTHSRPTRVRSEDQHCRHRDRLGVLRRRCGAEETCKRGGVQLTEILMPRIARQGAVCIISTK